ncbi:MAG: glycoside hydrolase family 4 [Verrucomicrobiota bacterium JB024]|nr:glycoside hydrolase family 4 [Verrucomicrobiota bacterium JB024]
MKRPKIVIIGAGSLFFGRQAIWAAANLPGFRGCTLSLVDIDAGRLDKLTALAKLVAGPTGAKIESSTNYRDALPGADFVVLSFSRKNTHYRRIECEVGAKYGVRSCSGDTIGPAGIFHAVREFPAILEITHVVEELCPEAWVINYVNPAATMGIGLMRHTKAKCIALCDVHHMPRKKQSYLDLIGQQDLPLDAFDMRIAGVNHCTWMLKAEISGRDVIPEIRDAFLRDSAGEKDEGYAKGRFNNTITAQLTDLYGAVPTCTGHTKEYVPYYQGHAAIQEKIPPLAVFDCDERDAWTAKMWAEIDEYISGEKSVEEFNQSLQSDHAADVMHTMVVEDGRTYFINRSNSDCVEDGGRAVDNLPEDAFLELECQLDRNGPRPLKVGSFPLGLRAMQYQILDIHELTIQAIMRHDRELLVRALSMDPIVNSIATARQLINELFVREKDALLDWPEQEEAGELAIASSAQASDSPKLQLY